MPAAFIATQRRKGTAIPYVSHLLAVASLTLEHGGDEDQAIAALLHDAAEDQGGQARLDDIAARFGPAVANIVADCTDSWVEPKPPWRERKEAYLAALPDKAAGLPARLACRQDPQCPRDRRRSALPWRKRSGIASTPAATARIWYYDAARGKRSAVHLPGPLADELRRQADAMPDAAS